MFTVFFYQILGRVQQNGNFLPIHAPQRAPRVLNNPVREPIFFSIANSQDSVVHFVRSVLTSWAAKEKLCRLFPRKTSL